MSIDSSKNLLRARYKGIRKSLRDSNEKPILDGKLFENLVKGVDFTQFRAVLCYVSFGIEVDTHALIDYLNTSGIPTYAPKCYKSDSSMRFFAVNGIGSLTYGEYKGILEPMEDTAKELLNFDDCLCIVPALAFDTQGYRLGWGGGYYDRFFSRNGNVFKVGLAYSTCIDKAIPRDPYDMSVDMVVTEKSILLCGGNDEH